MTASAPIYKSHKNMKILKSWKRANFRLRSCTWITSFDPVARYRRKYSRVDKRFIYLGAATIELRGGEPDARGPNARSREHLVWPASIFLLPKLEYNIDSKRSSMISRYLDSKSGEVTLPHS